MNRMLLSLLGMCLSLAGLAVSLWVIYTRR